MPVCLKNRWECRVQEHASVLLFNNPFKSSTPLHLKYHLKVWCFNSKSKYHKRPILCFFLCGYLQVTQICELKFWTAEACLVHKSLSCHWGTWPHHPPESWNSGYRGKPWSSSDFPIATGPKDRRNWFFVAWTILTPQILPFVFLTIVIIKDYIFYLSAWVCSCVLLLGPGLLGGHKWDSRWQ